MVYQEYAQMHEIATKNGQVIENVDMEMEKDDNGLLLRGNINGEPIIVESKSPYSRKFSRKNVQFLNQNTRIPNKIVRVLTPFLGKPFGKTMKIRRKKNRKNNGKSQRKKSRK